MNPPPPAFQLAAMPPANPADTGHLPPVTNKDVLSGAPTSLKVVTLTLDDGPSPSDTPIALAVGKQFHVPLTFFLVGQEMRKYPNLVRQEWLSGATLGDHTWHHPLVAVGDTRARWEVEQTAALMQSLTGVRPVYFRPPGGLLNTGTAGYARAAGMSVVTWTVFPNDLNIRRSAAVLAAEVIRTVRPGSIILLHDGGGHHLQSMRALPLIIATLHREGYTFVSLPVLLAAGSP